MTVQIQGKSIKAGVQIASQLQLTQYFADVDISGTQPQLHARFFAQIKHQRAIKPCASDIRKKRRALHIAVAQMHIKAQLAHGQARALYALRSETQISVIKYQSPRQEWNVERRG